MESATPTGPRKGEFETRGQAAPAHPARPWRDNIEALSMAIVLALMLKIFLVEAYKIPTGSMQPTLMGLGDPSASGEGLYVSDRILVDKLTPYFQDPERFQVVVFKYPLDRSKNFVKRICGMPGEFFRIRNGDLWHRSDGEQPWAIVPRPERVLASQLKHLIPYSGGESPWGPLSGTDGWQLTARRIEARGDGLVRFGKADAPILDRYYDGYPDVLRRKLPSLHPRETNNRVADLRLTGRVEALAGEVRVEFELQDGEIRCFFELPGPAAAEGARPAIRIEARSPLGGRIGEARRLEGEPWRLEAGRAVRFLIENLDDQVRLVLDGQTVASGPVEPQRDADSRVRIASIGAGANLSDLMLFRDIYYLTGDKHDDFEIPAGHYLMLGDNTQDSSDSREWTYARYELTDASSAPQPNTDPHSEDGNILRGNLRQTQNPYFLGNVTWLTDQWGERHALAVEGAPKPPLDIETQAVLGLPPQTAPFVPRELIVGRAIAVFWPVNPLQGLYRFKWVR